MWGDLPSAAKQPLLVTRAVCCADQLWGPRHDGVTICLQSRELRRLGLVTARTPSFLTGNPTPAGPPPGTWKAAVCIAGRSQSRSEAGLHLTVEGWRRVYGSEPRLPRLDSMPHVTAVLLICG